MKKAVRVSSERLCCIRTCLHKHMRTSFRQILPQTALKILAGRQPACGFLPCLQQNYARKSAHISYEDRFLLLKSHLFKLFCDANIKIGYVGNAVPLFARKPASAHIDFIAV